jgi:hypothetical protein
MKIYFIYCLLCLPAYILAQPAQYVQLRFVPKQGGFSPAKNDYQPGKNGFYLYENCMYTLVLRDDKQYNARIINVQKDTIVFTTHFNAAVAKKQQSSFDTLRISPDAISSIRLIGDRALGLFENVSMKKYHYEYTTDSLPKRLRIDTIQLYTNMPQRYELLPFLTSQGLNLLYEEGGNTFYFQGQRQKDTAAAALSKWQKKDDSLYRVKHIVWALPTRANKINGWAIGVHTGQLFGSALTINGLNTSADIPAMLVGTMGLVHIFSKIPPGSLTDSIDKAWFNTNINGLSLSIGGLMRGGKINGIAVNGGICTAGWSRGIVITGGYNLIADFKGLCIGGLRNVSGKGRGIQIALINVCRHFKGLQVGLWNVNGKRKLPFINWGA